MALLGRLMRRPRMVAREGGSRVKQRDLFISHASEDAVAARELRAELEGAGYTCWMAPDDVVGSRPWAEQILAAIDATRVMVVLISRHANDSVHVSREVNLALGHARAVLPVRIEPVAPGGSLEYLLSLVQHVDAFPPPVSTHSGRIRRMVDALLENSPEDEAHGGRGHARRAGRRCRRGRHRQAGDGHGAEGAGRGRAQAPRGPGGSSCRGRAGRRPGRPGPGCRLLVQDQGRPRRGRGHSRTRRVSASSARVSPAAGSHPPQLRATPRLPTGRRPRPRSPQHRAR